MACKDRVTGFCYVSVLMIVGATLLLSGCKKGQGREVPPPPTVEVVEVIRKDVPVFSEWIASTDGFVNATIRAQVQGTSSSRTTGKEILSRRGRSSSRSTRDPSKPPWIKLMRCGKRPGPPGTRPRPP